uniref:Uncharacterized protein n=1 Tax=Rhizophora mucronata TaxID=61149 RepID=A0A2P2NUM7_RHIMU
MILIQLKEIKLKVPPYMPYARSQKALKKSVPN